MKCKKIINFIIYVDLIIKRFNYSESQIFACDKTAVWFDNVGNYTLESKGKKSIEIKSTGHIKERITVVLMARVDGRKCKPYVVINRVRKLDAIDKEFGSDLNLNYSGCVWMDDNTTHDFLTKNFYYPVNIPRLLIWDSFRSHNSASTRQLMGNLKLNMAIIPGGCTGLIQPADVCWNKQIQRENSGRI